MKDESPGERGIKTSLNFSFPRNPHCSFPILDPKKHTCVAWIYPQNQASSEGPGGSCKKFAGNMQTHLYYKSLSLPLSYMEALPLLTAFVTQFFLLKQFSFLVLQEDQNRWYSVGGRIKATIRRPTGVRGWAQGSSQFSSENS